MPRCNEAKTARSKQERRSGTRGRRERRNRGGKRRRRVEMERGRGNKRQQYAWKEHLRLIIDHLSIRSLCSQPTLRNHYVRRVVFSTVKNPPCPCGGTVRCFFLNSKCRRHKCLFDLMTRCPTRTRAATYTREHLSPSLRSFRVSVGRATGPYAALLILLRKKGRERKKKD